MDAATSRPFRIGSAWRERTDPVITSIYPGDGSVAGVVARALPADVDDAVAVAREAFRARPWRGLRPDTAPVIAALRG